jgi:chromosome segregation ATPase
MDRIRSQAAELESQRMNQTRRWASVEEEVKKYRAESDSLRAALTSTRSELADLRRRYSDEERRLRDELSVGEEKVLALKEKILSDEQAYLKEKYELKEKISSLEEKLSRAEAALSDEKLHREKLSAKKDEEVKTLKEALLEKIKVITSLEEARIEEERLRIRAEERLSSTELEASNLKASVDEERRAFAKRIDEDRAASESRIKEISSAAGAAAADAESREAKMSRAVGTLEKALAEERAAKIIVEQKLSELRARLNEKTVGENELKHRLYTLELERNSEINRHDSEIASKEREIKRLEAQMDKHRNQSPVAVREDKK